MKLDTARDQFLAYKRSEGRQPATLRAYRWHLEQFIDWLHVTTGRQSVLLFTAQRVREYLDHRSAKRDLSMHTLNLDSTVLREFAAWGARLRYWPRETVDDIPVIRKPKTLPRPYDAADRNALMALPLNADDAVLRALLYYAGLRESEAIALRLRDIAPPHELPDGTTIDGHLKIWGKGAKERVVPMHPALWATLKPYLEAMPYPQPRDRFLLTRGDGRPWTAGMVQRRLRTWGKALGIERATAHRFRHTNATDMLEARADIREVQQLLGHESLATTQVYLKVTDRRKAEAIRLLPSFGPSVEPAAETIRPDYTAPAEQLQEAPEIPGKPAGTT